MYRVVRIIHSLICAGMKFAKGRILLDNRIEVHFVAQGLFSCLSVFYIMESNLFYNSGICSHTEM
jgi:hypothetical protein